MKSIARVGRSARGLRYFQLYLWGVLLFTVAVIISGDIVQATESGAGCGDSWPKCDGTLIPAFADIHMAIEFIHRMLTSVLSFGYFGLLIGGYLLFGGRHPVWRSILVCSLGTLLSIIFTSSARPSGETLYCRFTKSSSPGVTAWGMRSRYRTGDFLGYRLIGEPNKDEARCCFFGDSCKIVHASI